MVDAVVSVVVERLRDFLIKEVAFLRGVRDEVTWLKDELIAMQRFLKDAEEKQYEDATTRGWVSDIRELAYDIEDLLDTFQLKVRGEAEDDGETTEEKPESRCFPSMCSCISGKGKQPMDLSHIVKKQVNLYLIGKEIKEFKERLTNLSCRRQLYRIQDSGSSRVSRNSDLLKLKELRRANSFAIEEKVVGFEDDANQLLTKLLEDEPRRFIISIFGMGGLGKTTLARKVYHCSKAKLTFDCYAWVCVSQDYTAQDLLVRIIKSFGFRDVKLEDLQKMDEADLGRHLHQSLQKYSYLVVMDDVWNKEVWQSLKGYFPDNKNGSRVVITTRNQEVAECADERTHPHNLRKLRPDESWQLFCEKVCVPDLNANDQLKNLGREMVQKCDGLPLALIVLAGLLSRKKPQDWCVVRDHLWQHLRANSIEIHFLLALSFDGLPYQLKWCFIYLGIFPEDFEINVEKLIRLWVAEGFIPQVEDYIMEELAKAYVDELIGRSLIQVEKRYWGRIATCPVHDLLRDLAIEKAKSFNFLYIYDEVKHSNILPTLSSCMRQAVYSEVENASWLRNCNPRLRSLLLFAQGQQVVPTCKKFNSLRVLDDYSYFVQPMLGAEIGKLIHLKYLGLRNTRFALSPSSVSKLWRLQTLDTSGFRWPIDLSAEICKLRELRHLIGGFACSPLPIDNLTKLQTLKYVGVHYWRQIKTAKLVNLRELWIYGADDTAFSFDSMSNLKSLRILSVQPESGSTSFASLQPLSRCQHLVELRLRGKLEKLPRDIHKLLPNLQLLSLRDSQLEDDPMPLLEKLPYLTILHLGERFYIGKKIMCSDNGFLLLEILLVEHNFVLEEWQVGKDALLRLRGLWIPEHIKLTIPERLRSLPTLDPLEYTTWSPDLALDLF